MPLLSCQGRHQMSLEILVNEDLDVDFKMKSEGKVRISSGLSLKV
jgi:hypothetical protein